jgi:hypothetical protein
LKHCHYSPFVSSVFRVSFEISCIFAKNS